MQLKSMGLTMRSAWGILEGQTQGTRLFQKLFLSNVGICLQSSPFNCTTSAMSSGHKFELLCLENPLLDIQGQGYGPMIVGSEYSLLTAN
jgi:hypothetical protein